MALSNLMATGLEREISFAAIRLWSHLVVRMFCSCFTWSWQSSGLQNSMWHNLHLYHAPSAPWSQFWFLSVRPAVLARDSPRKIDEVLDQGSLGSQRQLTFLYHRHCLQGHTRCSNNSCALCLDLSYYKRATVNLYMSLVKLNRLLVCNIVLGKCWSKTGRQFLRKELRAFRHCAHELLRHLVGTKSQI